MPWMLRTLARTLLPVLCAGAAHAQESVLERLAGDGFIEAERVPAAGAP